MMSKQLYINGKPASLFQQIIAVILGIGALIVFAFFGLAIFVIGLGVTAIFAVYFFWKTRKVRKQFRSEMNRAKERAEAHSFAGHKDTNQTGEAATKGQLYEGEYKEL